MACLGRSGLPCALCAQPPPSPPLCPARHLGAPRCSLCERALRLLYMRWAIEGVYASACTMAGPSVAWLARSGPPRVPAARETPPPLPSEAPRRASLLLVCARPAPAVHVAGYRMPLCVSLHNGRAWRGVVGSQCVGARETPPTLPSAAPRRTSLLLMCARPAPALHVAGYRGPLCDSLQNGRAWRGVVGSQRPPACVGARETPPPTAQRGASPRLGTPCVLALCARCTCGGLSGVFLRQPAQWQGLAWRGWLAAASRVCWRA